MAAVEKAGLFADIDQATTAQVPSQYRPSTNKWTGVAARTTVFAYNPSKLTPEQLPKSIMDLEKPEWKGRWGAPPVKPDFQAIVAAMLQLTGEPATATWLSAMKAERGDLPGQPRHPPRRQRRPGRRRRDLPLLLVPRSGRRQGDQPNTELHYFGNQDPGAFVSVSGGGVLESSKKKEQAQKFLTFITSKAGQEVLEKGTSFEYPVASGVPANPALKPLAELQAPAVNPSDLNAQAVTDLMTKAGLL